MPIASEAQYIYDRIKRNQARLIGREVQYNHKSWLSGIQQHKEPQNLSLFMTGLRGIKHE